MSYFLTVTGRRSIIGEYRWDDQRDLYAALSAVGVDPSLAAEGGREVRGTITIEWGPLRVAPVTGRTNT